MSYVVLMFQCIGTPLRLSTFETRLRGDTPRSRHATSIFSVTPTQDTSRGPGTGRNEQKRARYRFSSRNDAEELSFVGHKPYNGKISRGILVMSTPRQGPKKGLQLELEWGHVGVTSKQMDIPWSHLVFALTRGGIAGMLALALYCN